MWRDMVAGASVLIEHAQRWYLGIVEERTSVTVRLTPELAIMGHNLGDTGMFLEGRISGTTELTPLPRGVELALAGVESVQPYPRELLEKICRRTHSEQGEKAP